MGDGGRSCLKAATWPLELRDDRRECERPRWTGPLSLLIKLEMDMGSAGRLGVFYHILALARLSIATSSFLPPLKAYAQVACTVVVALRSWAHMAVVIWVTAPWCLAEQGRRYAPEDAVASGAMDIAGCQAMVVVDKVSHTLLASVLWSQGWERRYPSAGCGISKKFNGIDDVY